MSDENQEQVTQATESTEVEVQPEVDAQPEEQQEGLPEDVSERTKREFEKLKKHNAELAKKLAEKEETPRPSLLEAYQPQPTMAMPQYAPVAPNLPQTRVEEITKQLWDEEGTIDGNELQRRLALAEQAEIRARQAESKAQSALERIARYEADGQKKMLHEKFPELDPSRTDVFNEEAYELVRKELVDQLWQKGTQDPLEAAEKMSKYWKPKEVSPQQRETLQERQAVISKPASGKASSGATKDYEELRKQSLYSKEAMEERIRRSGI